MFKDCVRDVAKQQCKNSLGQMFSVESTLVKKTLLKWFNTKFKQSFSCIKPIIKLRFESENKLIGKHINAFCVNFQQNFGRPIPKRQVQL